MHEQGQQYLDEFDRLEKSLNGMASSPIHALRKQAISRFAALGFPTMKQVEWRFTIVGPVARTAFEPILQYQLGGVSPETINRYSFGEATGGLLVFINGHWSREYSRMPRLPKGAVVESLAAAMKSQEPRMHGHLARYVPFAEHSFAALNTAFMQDGLFVYLPDGTTIEEPLHLLFLATGGGRPFMANPRNLIVLGKNCRLSLAESYVGVTDALYLTTAISEVV